MGDPYSEFNEGETALETICARWTCTACGIVRPMWIDPCSCGSAEAAETFYQVQPRRPLKP